MDCMHYAKYSCIKWEDKIKTDLEVVVWGAWTGLICFELGQVAGTCNYVNEPSRCIKCREFLD